MSNETIDFQCEHCGQAFSAFLHQMADKNAKVVCPKCGKSHDGKLPEAAQPATGTQKVKKII